MKKSSRKINGGEEYIETFPRLKKWINECNCCKRTGYDPSMPDNISVYESSLSAYFIKKYFEPLELDKDGLCDVCAKLFK